MSLAVKTQHFVPDKIDAKIVIINVNKKYSIVKFTIFVI